MRPTLALRVAALALLMGGAADGALRAAPPEAHGALPLELVDVATGNPVQLEAGPKVLHIVVFATWCRPCEAELPALAEWETRFGAAGYRLVIVALAERQSRDRLVAFTREHRPPGRWYFDASRRMEKALNFDGVPAHYLLDAEGRVRARAGSLGELNMATVENMLGETGTAHGKPR